MIDVVMPQMGESIVEGTLTRWTKKVGEKIERDEPLFEISTDKVDTEIPAPRIRHRGRDPGAGRPDRGDQHAWSAESTRPGARRASPAAQPASKPAPPPPPPAPASKPAEAAPAPRLASRACREGSSAQG